MAESVLTNQLANLVELPEAMTTPDKPPKPLDDQGSPSAASSSTPGASSSSAPVQDRDQAVVTVASQGAPVPVDERGFPVMDWSVDEDLPVPEPDPSWDFSWGDNDERDADNDACASIADTELYPESLFSDAQEDSAVAMAVGVAVAVAIAVAVAGAAAEAVAGAVAVASLSTSAGRW